MPRRNRRKLHRMLRLRAEKRDAARAADRQRARYARQATERAIARALRRPKTSTTGQPTGQPPQVTLALASMNNLMELAGVGAPTRGRVRQVVEVVGRAAPSLARCEFLPWYLLLARRTWHRGPHSWKPPGGSDRRKRDDLALHLLTAYAVPPFLVRALDVDPLPVARIPVEEEWAVRLLCWVGQGHSLRKVPASVLPTPLTRRMAHEFLSATARTPPIVALRRAQVHGHGGAPELARLLLGTRLGVLRGDDQHVGEPFWDQVIAWLAKRPALWSGDAESLDRLLGWAEHAQRQAVADGRTLTLRGRTDRSILQAADRWWARRRPPRGHFPSSGLEPLQVGSWQIVELDTPRALRDEGQAMAHCVGTYVGLARKRRVSLWSIRRGAERRATVEVALPAATVVQAKGRANRAIGVEESSLLHRWATANRLMVRLRG